MNAEPCLTAEARRAEAGTLNGERLYMNCPKCGFEQKEGPECPRCGIIFARYHAARAPSPPQSVPVQESGRFSISPLRRIFRVFRWVSVVVLSIVLLLILKPSTPPEIAITPEATQRAEAKIGEFHRSARRGAARNLELDESELNGWMSQNLALKKPDAPVTSTPPQSVESLISMAQKVSPHSMLSEAEVQEVQSSVRDIKIELMDDSLRLYAIFDFHGMDLSLELEGKLLTRAGYLRLEPTGGKLGSFPLMAGTLQKVAERLFDSPANKEQFRLPSHIRDMRIDCGRIVIASQ